MARRFVVAAGCVCALLLAAPAGVVADYWDNFDDGEYCQDPNDPNIFDPNLWDPCNPHWTVFDAVPGPVFFADANDGALRLYIQPSGLYPWCVLVAYADDGDRDPNTSAAWFDNSAAHYILTKVSFNPAAPNDSGMMILINADPGTWNFYSINYESGGTNDNNLGLQWGSGTDYVIIANVNLRDPEPDEPNGFWVLLQYDPADPHGTQDANDPNNHWLRAAYWNGDRSDWDGTWVTQTAIINPAWDPGTYDYWAEGGGAVASYGDSYTGPTHVGDVKFDDVEVRWGYFGQGWPTTLTLKLKDANAIYVYPNLPQYDKGTVVVCDAVGNGSKAFKKWTIKGPNDESDPLYQVIVDTNAVLYLTMDGDYLVKATCKCGGGGIEPFACMVLLVLGLSVAVRRLT